MKYTSLFINATLALALPLLVSACGSDPVAADPTLSCNVEASFTCYDFSTDFSSTEARAACTSYQGDYSAAAACSSTDRVGRCAVTTSGVTQTFSYYSGGDSIYTAEIVEAACTAASGEFTADL